MLMFLSIILGLVVMFLITFATQTLRSGLTEKIETQTGRFRWRLKGLSDLNETDWLIAATVGATTGVINYFTPKLYALGVVWLAPVFLVVMVAMFIGLMVWWSRAGASFREMIPFILLAVLFFLVAKSTAWMTTVLWSSLFWTSVVTTLPVLLLVATLGFFVIDLLYFRYREVDSDEESARRHHVCGIIAIIVTTLLLVLFALKGISWANFNHPTREAKNYESETEVAEVNDDAVVVEIESKSESESESENIPNKSWIHFYNLDLLKDKDDTNDYNFGANPVKENLTAEDYDRIFRERLKKDPALAAADTAWLDANVGTRYLGEFYESCKGDWAKTINEAKDRFSTDQTAFYKNLDAFFLFLDHAYEVSIEYRTSGLDDQMYMNPFTLSGVPDVVVFKTLDHEGWFLVYKFKIKNSATTIDPETGEVRNIEVAYRIDCGFQPTNVEEVMDITPQENPVSTPTPTPDTPTPDTPTPTPTPDPPTPTPDPPTPTPTPDTPTPTPTPTPDTPTPTPTPTPKPTKDPSKAPPENTEPNDDPGPGEDTNNGEGATESPKDQPTNSDKYDSYEEYRQEVEELKKTNETQRTGEDSSTPSTPKPTKDTTVDNNGATGTKDSAPINEPTQVTEPAKEADTGNAISDSPGEAWGGPPD